MSSSIYDWYQFGQPKNYEELKEYMKERQYEHSYYYHYTSLKNIESILENKELWISCVDGFNDTKDKKQFEGQEKEYYSFCFSTGVSENLPLWYLYGGIDGKGGRIRFTKNTVNEYIFDDTENAKELNFNPNIKCVLAQKKDGEIKRKESITLKVAETMDIEFRDVLYYSNNNEKIRLKYNTMTNYDMLKDSAEKLEKDWNHFLKGLIWYYEKETRLLIHLKGEALKEVKANKDKGYVVVLKMSDSLMNKMQVTLSPQFNTVEEVLETEKYPNIGKLIGKSRKKWEKDFLSDYHGTIDFKLCDNCEKNKENNNE